jgi:hypothetical protein
VAERPVALPPVRRSMGATLASDNQNECIGYARECVRLARLTFEQQIRDILLDMAHEWTAVAMDEWAEPVRIMDEDVIVAAQDPAERPRMDNGESFQDPAINEPFHSEVSVQEDRYENGEWRIKYFDADGGCYVTIFAGPEAEKRARNYFQALKAKWLKTIRARTTPEAN